MDAALVSPGAPTPFPNLDQKPDLSLGMHALLANNIWGTNYVMWQPYGGRSATQRFRFVIQVNAGRQVPRSRHCLSITVQEAKFDTSQLLTSVLAVLDMQMSDAGKDGAAGRVVDAAVGDRLEYEDPDLAWHLGSGTVGRSGARTAAS